MYTQCPDCLTVFALAAETLAQARGQVRCGHCGARFDALESLAEHLPSAPFRHLPATPAVLELPSVDAAVYRPAHDPSAPSVATSIDIATPRFAAAARTRKPWGWIVACLLLGLCLLAQLGWAGRRQWIADPLIGGWLRHGCAALGCELPLIASPHQLRLLARQVQADPAHPDGLQISASLRNDAVFAQPYPVLSITLADAAGKRLGLRRLRPAEYLADPAVRRRGLASGATAALLIEVENPGGAASAFVLDFE